MTFKDYYLRAEKKYDFRLKTIVALDDYAMDMIERVLRKYNPSNIERPKKTIMQKNPLDFVGINYAEVHIVDFTTTLPVSVWILRRELEVALNVPEKYVVVRSKDDPMEEEAEKLAGDEPKEKEDDTPLVGDARTNKLLNYVDELEKKRKESIADEVEKNIKSSFLATLIPSVKEKNWETPAKYDPLNPTKKEKK